MDTRWTEWGDLYLYDTQAKIKGMLTFKTLPHGSAPRITSMEVFSPDLPDAPGFEFQIASIKSLDEETTLEKIPQEYQDLIRQYPELLTATFKSVENKQGIKHYIETNDAKPCRAKLRKLMPGTPRAEGGKKAWEELVQLGIVEPVDTSKPCTWSSALHLQAKPSGG